VRHSKSGISKKVHKKFWMKTQGKIPLEDTGTNVRITLELTEIVVMMVIYRNASCHPIAYKGIIENVTQNE
jgi:hypothetical protein